MKNYLTILFAIIISCLQAQQEGRIVFEETIKFEIELSEEMKQFADMIPNEQNSQKEFIYNSTSSIFKTLVKEQDEEQSFMNGGVQVQIMTDNPENEMYKNFDDQKFIQKEDFFGKTFLITQEPITFNWKIGDKQKEILGLKCTNAISADTSGTTEVWFTSEIPISNGPDMYHGLPGMILEVASENRKIVASKIDFQKVDASEIIAPKKGKKVSSAEYYEIMQEKMKEMEKMNSGNGSFQIISQ